MSSSGKQLYNSGKIVATNAALQVKTVGFKPDRVKIQNLTNNCMVEWNAELANAYGLKTVAAGTRSVVSADGITPVSGENYAGFQIGALADINDTTTEELLWEAWG